MTPKDLGGLLILTLILNGVAMVSCALMIEKFTPMTSGTKTNLTIYCILTSVGMFFSALALVMKANGLNGRLQVLMWAQFIGFITGVAIAGAAFNRNNKWMSWADSHHRTLMPSIFLGIAALVQLGVVFMLQSGRDQLKSFELDPNSSLSSLMCGSGTIDDGEGEFVKDTFYQVDKRRKPTFHNRRQPEYEPIMGSARI